MIMLMQKLFTKVAGYTVSKNKQLLYKNNYQLENIMEENLIYNNNKKIKMW